MRRQKNEKYRHIQIQINIDSNNLIFFVTHLSRAASFLSNQSASTIFKGISMSLCNSTFSSKSICRFWEDSVFPAAQQGVLTFACSYLANPVLTHRAKMAASHPQGKTTSTTTQELLLIHWCWFDWWDVHYCLCLFCPLNKGMMLDSFQVSVLKHPVVAVWPQCLNEKCIFPH